MRIILNGKEIKNVEVLKFESEKSNTLVTKYETRKAKGGLWFVIV